MPKNPYFFIHSLKIIEKSYQRADTIKVLYDLLERKPLLKVAFNIHNIFKGSYLSCLCIFCYGIYKFLRTKYHQSKKHKIAFSYEISNELKAINYLLALINDQGEKKSTWQKNLFFLFKNIKIKKIYQILKIIKAFDTKLELLPTIRITNTIFCSFIFNNYFKLYQNKSIITSSLYAPEAVGLRIAANHLEIPLIYITKSLLSWDTYSPPLIADLAVVYGNHALLCFKKNSFVNIKKHIFTGFLNQNNLSNKLLQNTNHEYLTIPNSIKKIKKIGFFLSALCNLEKLIAEVNFLLNFSEIELIIIRPHPTTLISYEEKDFSFKDQRIEFSFGGNVYDVFPKINLCISGESTVHLESVLYGLPSLYIENLDHIKNDYYGLIESSIIYKIESLKEYNFNSISNFYNNQNWRKKISLFNPFLEDNNLKDKSAANIENYLQKEIINWLEQNT